MGTVLPSCPMKAVVWELEVDFYCIVINSNRIENQRIYAWCFQETKRLRAFGL